jgi:putative redox protein
MGEKVIIRQNSQYNTKIFGTDPEEPKSKELHPVKNIYDLSPYGMLLASLGSCTAVLLNSFAENHGLDLTEVEVQLEYKRSFKEDCKNCEEIEKYEDRIDDEIKLIGNLKQEEREKLFLVSRHCPIHKMLKGGIEVRSKLV